MTLTCVINHVTITITIVIALKISIMMNTCVITEYHSIY